MIPDADCFNKESIYSDLGFDKESICSEHLPLTDMLTRSHLVCYPEISSYITTLQIWGLILPSTARDNKYTSRKTHRTFIFYFHLDSASDLHVQNMPSPEWKPEFSSHVYTYIVAGKID